ncbi:hypothetical protein U3516DRAFT_799827 [Neocallimastix sp. 'constans']
MNNFNLNIIGKGNINNNHINIKRKSYLINKLTIYTLLVSTVEKSGYSPFLFFLFNSKILLLLFVYLISNLTIFILLLLIVDKTDKTRSILLYFSLIFKLMQFS